MGEVTIDYTQSGAALPTLAQLRQRVYAPLRDSERSFIEPWFVDQLLNEAYLDLNARLRLKRGVQVGTTTAAGVVGFPTDLVEIIDLWIGGDIVKFQDDMTFQTAQNNSVTVSGIIGRVNYIAGGWAIETYPEQQSLAFELNYVSRPDAMTTDLTTPSHLTHELCPRIVSYARAHCKWQEGEEAEGQRYMAMYEQGIPAAPREQFRRRPQQFEIIPQIGPMG